MNVDLQKLRQLRRKRNLTLEEVSQKLGYASKNGYYYQEAGKTAIKASQLSQLAKIFGVPVDELYLKDSNISGNIANYSDGELIAVFNFMQTHEVSGKEDYMHLLISELQKRDIYWDALIEKKS